MDAFNACRQVNDFLHQKDENSARNALIKILDYYEQQNLKYDPVVNHLIRQVGLYPYLQIETASWQDRFAYESFKSDVGAEKPVTLHREQASILKKLMIGKSLAVSAPTSFGKSFIIDSFISLKKPKNIVIIVPTIALTDETRRRLQRKFSSHYKIITTSDVELEENNILIFPQERAIHYLGKISDLDMLVIDEFYKASPKFDKERSSSLLNAILKLGKKAKQKYFLAPNITSINESIFTKGMEFVHVDFNTVYLEKYNLYKHICGDENKKSDELLKVLRNTNGKSLIYAGTYSNIDKVSNLLIDNNDLSQSKKLKDFEYWLTKNYGRNWHLTNLVKRGSGIHNGQLHRSLSQIQVKLFEEEDGLKNLISTSSIIEGVNTSAENVIIWRNRNGRSRLNDFTYKNIIGRGGRMFKHFIGKIYLLEEPPESAETRLELNFPDELLSEVDEIDFKNELSKEQIAKIISYKEEMTEILGEGVFNELQKEKAFESSNSFLIRDIAIDISTNESSWNGLGYLNSNNIEDWDRLLYKVIKLQPGGWGIEYNKFVGFIKILTANWTKTIPELLYELDELDIGVDDFFKLERNVTYKFSSLLNDVNVIQKKVFSDQTIDLSPFIVRISHAFLPPTVYQLEEYGLPRMISKKLHESRVINFEDSELDLHKAINILNKFTYQRIKEIVQDLDNFDYYILEYFFDGISINKPKIAD
ncbi:MAG: DEAD/DEAH box helicase [Colwellia sp.]|nr:DEAD/DEAH box helicase [Colwellia sp.]